MNNLTLEQTTKIDYSINQLLTTGKTTLYDKRNDLVSSKKLYNKFIHRMYSEHHKINFSTKIKNDCGIDYYQITIF